MEWGFYIRRSESADLGDILRINTEAFGQDEEAKLVRDLLEDATARPLLSLLAFEDEIPVGHILFTRVSVGDKDTTPSAAILAPLAVKPAAQGRRVGGHLIRVGLALLAEEGVELVFVLGHPAYYPRYGFRPAGVLGFEAPYPIPPEHAGAWMVQELKPGVIDTIAGKVCCADALDHPELWSE